MESFRYICQVWFVQQKVYSFCQLHKLAVFAFNWRNDLFIGKSSGKPLF